MKVIQYLPALIVAALCAGCVPRCLQWLLVPERRQWIHARRAPRRDAAGQQRHGRQQQRDHRRTSAGRSRSRRRAGAESAASRRTRHRRRSTRPMTLEQHALADDELEQVARLRAVRQADAHLARALGHAHTTARRRSRRRPPPPRARRTASTMRPPVVRHTASRPSVPPACRGCIEAARRRAPAPRGGWRRPAHAGPSPSARAASVPAT